MFYFLTHLPIKLPIPQNKPDKGTSCFDASPNLRVNPIHGLYIPVTKACCIPKKTD